MRWNRKLAAAFVVFALIAGACGTGADDAARSGSLCEFQDPRAVDFGDLDEIVEHIQESSYFYVEANVNLEGLYLGAFDAVYRFVGLTEADMPDEVRATIMEKADRGEVDFSILQDHIKDLLASDARFEQLGRVDKQSQVYTSAANGVINALKDPFATYTPPENIRGRNQQRDGGFVGFGFQFDRNDRNEFQITSVHEGQPAQLAGLQAGDRVLMIDGLSLEDCSSRSFGDALVGDLGETTVFTVRHANGVEEDLPITRGDVTLTAVVSWPGVIWSDGRGSSAKEVPFRAPMVDRDGNVADGILYIGYWDFRENATADMGYIIRNTPKNAYKNGIILDLRGNGGGSLGATQQLLDYFFDDAVVSHIDRDRDGRERSYTIPDRFDLAIDVPLVILVGPDPYGRQGANDNSYSASELTAGAMQDYGRAIVVGFRQTGGKGLVGNTFDLRDGGALMLEVREYFTPNGDVIQGEDLNGDGTLDTGGVIPDIIIEWTDEDYRKKNRNPSWDPDLFEAIDVLLGKK